jgi:AraC family transcriptional regulator of adaptative response/methylated-DNA-[protein]-cysteine methyltransferase
MARAIDFIAAHADKQPGLDETAAAAGLSPFHFQRLFSRWVGVSPKRFLQVLTVERAKTLLDEGAPVLAAADGVGLSSGSRLHDHFVSLEAVTPGEYRAGGPGLRIGHGLADSPFGSLFVAWTPRGICRLEFVDATPAAPLATLVNDWPGAELLRDDTAAANLAGRLFAADSRSSGPLSLHVQGTNFQVAVWRALLGVAPAAVTSYSALASGIGRPRAARAVGAAVGANPVGWLIPCHRVIRQSGEMGGYRWGIGRKRAMLSWEAARAG